PPEVPPSGSGGAHTMCVSQLEPAAQLPGSHVPVTSGDVDEPPRPPQVTSSTHTRIGWQRSPAAHDASPAHVESRQYPFAMWHVLGAPPIGHVIGGGPTASARASDAVDSATSTTATEAKRMGPR